MRVLFYHSARAWSGSARAFAAAARGLAARGHDVTYVCAPESAVEARLGYSDYEVLPLAESRSRLVTAWRLRRALRDRFVEVAFVHGERDQLVAALATRLGARAATLRRVPTGEAPALGRAARFAARLAATGLLFTSEEELRAAPTLRGARITAAVAPLGVDHESYDAVRPAARASIGVSAASRLIACVYEPAGRTRVASVLRATALLAPRHPELRLAVVGTGSDEEDLRMHAAALGITRAVAFLGERDDYLAVLRAADVGWVVADGDTAGYALLDLLALRVPALADRDGVSGHFVADGINGLLLPPGNAAATAAALARLLARPEQLEAMGAAGRARVGREFTEAAMVDGFEQAARAASGAGGA